MRVRLRDVMQQRQAPYRLRLPADQNCRWRGCSEPYLLDQILHRLTVTKNPYLIT